jgi:hypothetical protein
MNAMSDIAIQNPLTTRPFLARYFTLNFDSLSQEVGWLRSVEGGSSKMEVQAQFMESVQKFFSKEANGTSAADPISFDIGGSISKAFWEWIKKSWNPENEIDRKGGWITAYDHTLKPRFEQSFENAMITETTVPALDGSSKEAVYFKVKIQPETVAYKVDGHGGAAKTAQPETQKAWSAANFRFDLGAIRDSCKGVNKIDAFTIKQVTVSKKYKMWDDQSGLVDNVEHAEPARVEFPNITIYSALAYAEPWFKWYDEFVKHTKSSDQLTEGAITFLSANRKNELLTINLKGVGPVSVSVEKRDASSDGVLRAKMELFVESMDLEY